MSYYENSKQGFKGEANRCDNGKWAARVTRPDGRTIDLGEHRMSVQAIAAVDNLVAKLTTTKGDRHAV